MRGDGAALWQRAVLAASLFAVDPPGTGMVVRARAGPVRDRFAALLRAACGTILPWRTLPQGIPDDRLLGGLDLPATLKTGRPVAGRGLLAEVHGGILVLPGAERATPELVGRLVAVLDTGELCAEREGLSIRAPSRFGLVALDEGAEPDERVPAALSDRLAFHVDLDAVSVHDARDGPATQDAVARARGRAVEAAPHALETLAATALALGVDSARGWVLALRAARAHAAISGRQGLEQPDLEAAAALVLAPRATRLPPQREPAEAEETPPPEMPPSPPEAGDDQEPRETAEPPADLVLEAALAAIPPGLLAALQAASLSRRHLAGGKSGAATRSRLRGRPLGAVPGDPRRARIALVETLRAAAPWQRLRRRDHEVGTAPRLVVRQEDVRVRRYRQHSETTTIFAVDASGSAALQRLAEAKGAVELLLADCYVRRDRVALVTFRGREAELALPPTRSLVRARRSLAGLPGGGGTPLAAGIETAGLLAESLVRRGQSAVLVLLTDGKANVARDGAGGRPRALDDAVAAATRVRLAGIPALLIDTAPQPHPSAARIAEALHARYVPLPHADSARVSAAVREILPGR